MRFAGSGTFRPLPGDRIEPFFGENLITLYLKTARRSAHPEGTREASASRASDDGCGTSLPEEET